MSEFRPPNVDWGTEIIDDYKIVQSSLLKLDIHDFAKGAVTAVFSAVIVALGSMVSTPGFNVFATDWKATLNIAFQVAVAAFLGYIGKNYLTDADGKVFGKI